MSRNIRIRFRFHESEKASIFAEKSPKLTSQFYASDRLEHRLPKNLKERGQCSIRSSTVSYSSLDRLGNLRSKITDVQYALRSFTPIYTYMPARNVI